MKLNLVFWLLVIGCVISCKMDGKKHANHSKNKLQENQTSIKNVPKLVSNQLPSKTEEQSGIIWHDNLFWVNNDSDCKPELYAYDINGEWKQTIRVAGAKNIDWEDLAEDSKYFYIGDFGNNHGTRRNLRILRIEKSNISKQEIVTVTCDTISFEWADQTSFLPRRQKHNYDCEAFFSYQDSLYLFTKNWGDLKTKMYVIPKEKGHYKLNPKTTFNADLLVTGADISTNGDYVALIGYKNYRTYLILYYDFAEYNFFDGKHIRFDMSELGGVQTEGIVFTDKDELYITTEATKEPQALYHVNWKQWIKE